LSEFVVDSRDDGVAAPARAEAVPAITRVGSSSGPGSSPTVQTKLTVGAVADPYEREADRVADQVMSLVQRMAAGGPPPVDAHTCGPDCAHDDGAGRVRRAPGAPGAVPHACGPGCGHDVAPRIRRAPAPAHRCGPGCVQRHAGHHDHHDHGNTPEVGAEGGQVTPELGQRIRASGGAPLGDGLRGPMEQAFGADFSGVRVHTDSDVAPRIGASAFTTGSDIHFAPGEYRPDDRAGQRLLAHELTHVVQQTGAGLAVHGDVHRHFGSCIQRHASKEHYLLGSMTPAKLRSIADGKAAAEKADTGFLSLFTTKPAKPEEVAEGLTAVREQLVGLENWRKVAGPGDPDPSQINLGDTTYHHEWGGQLVSVQCRDGAVVCTLGDLNAIPDFFGSIDDLKLIDRSIVFKTLQVIRRESYMYLKGLEAQLQGKKYSYDAEKEGFSGLAGNKISIAGVGPKATDDLGDLWETEKMIKGGKGETGLDDSIGAAATLGRNACHFPPESWLRWREHHTKARTLIASATDQDSLNRLANEAIATNAFGEHYLQDSYAAGHLINKGFVMAVALEKRVTNALSPAKVAEIQAATAHSEAYKLPGDAKAKIDAAQQGGAVTNSLDDPNLKARDPQSALESAKELGAQGASKKAGKLEEVRASGIDPSVVSFDEFRGFLNDLWLQKITNTLHDKYCVNGLTVASPDNPTLFKIYGDSNMMRSGAGAEYTATTSLMSRSAINALVENKRDELTAAANGTSVNPARQVYSVEEIVARFPNRVVDDDGTVMDLETWATGAPMRKKINAITAALGGDFVTGLLRGVSLGKDVSPGLGAAHGPF
jgi:hypothetical protein